MTLLDAALSILAARKSALTLAELTAAAISSKQVSKVTPAQEKALGRGLDKLAASGEGVEKVGEAYRAGAGAGASKNGKAKVAPAKAKAAPAKAKAAPAKAKAAPAKAKGKAAKPSDEAPAVVAAAPAEAVEIEDAPPPMTDEERALAEVYGDELGAPAPALREFRDERTRDEDRKMLPEINARQERHKQWEDRRNERRERRERERNERRERRDRERPAGGGRDAQQGGGGAQQGGGGRDAQASGGGGRPDGRPDGGGRGEGQRERAEARPEQPRVVVATGTGIGTPLGDAAAALFVQLRNAQPVPVKQLAGMMRKRGLIEADPEQVWPHLKASLLGDERIFRARGLRPRIVYRGRDLFAPGPVMSSPTAAAESTLADALAGLAAATARTLATRLARANQAGFERLAHAYLVAAGFADITWVKRLDGISYATALPAGGDKAILISARSGDSPVERRGVGELRVGVEAKDLAWGLLLAARELSDEARRELERPGRSISTLVGDGLVAALMAAGVGVVTAAAPVRYLDEQLLDELLAGA